MSAGELSAFERAQLRAMALQQVVKQSGFWTRVPLHPSTIRAIEAVADWYGAPADAPFPEFVLEPVDALGAPYDPILNGKDENPTRPFSLAAFVPSPRHMGRQASIRHGTLFGAGGAA